MAGDSRAVKSEKARFKVCSPGAYAINKGRGGTGGREEIP